MLSIRPKYIPLTEMLDDAFWTRDYAGLRVTDTGEALSATVDLPGVTADGVTIQHERGVLTVEARRDGRVTRYQRTLGTEVDAAGAKATLRDGVLRVDLPKARSALPVRIEIN